jgi:hypothetical protein
MTQTTGPELLPLPTGISQVMKVPAGRIMLLDNLDLEQPIYGQVLKVEIVEIDGHPRTRITVSGGMTWTTDSRIAVRISRVT